MKSSITFLSCRYVVLFQC